MRFQRVATCAIATCAAIAALSGCASTYPTATPSPTMEETPTPTQTPMPTPTIAFTVKDPVGACRTTATTIEAPSDVEQVCTYRRMILGHTLPNKETYLSRIVPAMKPGDRVSMAGQTWVVTKVVSIRKTDLPDEWDAVAGSDRYLVTCDPSSGYKNGHSLNNLIAVLSPAR